MRQPCLLASAGRLRNCAGYRGIPMSNQRVPVRGHFIRGSEQTIYRELSRKEERRQQFRYGLRARVDFRWKDREKFYHHGEGFTRDISPTGMFVYADSHPPPKADIRVEVELERKVISQAIEAHSWNRRKT